MDANEVDDARGGSDPIGSAWRVLRSWDASPTFNMGLDEALLLDHDAPPTLRLYTWRPDALSLGYFQRAADVPGRDAAGAVVRRITGGGAIHHAGELTFSLVCGQTEPLYRGPVAASYRRVHAAVIEALGSAGVDATLREERALRSDVPGTGMCFHASTPLDVVWEEGKGVGSAQRRTRGRVLHHGSIKLETTPLEGDIATIAAVASPVTAPHLGEALIAAFARRGLVLTDGVVTSKEREAAQRLGARYADPAFVERR